MDWALRCEVIAYAATETEPVVRPASEFTACFTVQFTAVQFTADRSAQHIFGRAIEPAPERNRSSMRDERPPWQLWSIRLSGNYRQQRV